MKFNIESPGEENIQSRELPMIEELRTSLAQLTNNGNSFDLQMFIKKYGIQETPLELSGRSEKGLNAFMDTTLTQIEKNQESGSFVAMWKLLKDAGVLTADKLQQYIENYKTTKITSSDKEIEESLEKFRNRIKEITNTTLGWDLSI